MVLLLALKFTSTHGRPWDNWNIKRAPNGSKVTLPDNSTSSEYFKSTTTTTFLTLPISLFVHQRNTSSCLPLRRAAPSLKEPKSRINLYSAATTNQHNPPPVKSPPSKFSKTSKKPKPRKFLFSRAIRQRGKRWVHQSLLFLDVLRGLSKRTRVFASHLGGGMKLYGCTFWCFEALGLPQSILFVWFGRFWANVHDFLLATSYHEDIAAWVSLLGFWSFEAMIVHSLIFSQLITGKFILGLYTWSCHWLSEPEFDNWRF